jgi:hypothetical protein
VNGRYILTGVYNSRNYYVKEGGTFPGDSIIFINTWLIKSGDLIDAHNKYYSTGPTATASTPDLVGSWQIPDPFSSPTPGIAPLPTVRAEAITTFPLQAARILQQEGPEGARSILKLTEISTLNIGFSSGTAAGGWDGITAHFGTSTTSLYCFGAGNPEINGLYVTNGTYQSKTQWIKSGGTSYIRWQSGAWHIGVPTNNSRYYSFDSNPASPDVVVSWRTIGTGVLPVPVVVVNKTPPIITTAGKQLVQADQPQQKSLLGILGLEMQVSGLGIHASGLGTQIVNVQNQKADKSILLNSGSGLSGGGNLTENRTLSLSAGSISSLAKADTALQPTGNGSQLTGFTASQISDSTAVGRELLKMYPPILVSGAGTSEANSTYTPRGIFNDKPFYNKVGSASSEFASSIFWSTTESGWVIDNVDEYGLYYSPGDIATPDLVINWLELGEGDAPAPTVTITTLPDDLILETEDGKPFAKRTFASALAANLGTTAGTVAAGVDGTSVRLLGKGAISVYNAGNEDANGYYLVVGEENGKLKYGKVSDQETYIFWFGGAWRWIVGESPAYVAWEDVETPVSVTSWGLEMAGSMPLPDISTSTEYSPGSTGLDLLRADTQVHGRDALGLGGAAILNVGTTAGTVAAADDSRIVNATPTSRTISTGTGLEGGGDLSANRTLGLTSGVQSSLSKADTALQTHQDISGKQDKQVTVISDATTSRVLGLSDSFGFVRMTNAGAKTVTVQPEIDVVWEAGTIITIRNAGAGVLTFTEGAGVTINPDDLEIQENGTAQLIKVGTNTWDLIGGDEFVRIDGNQSIDGTKTFTSPVVVPAAVAGGDAVNLGMINNLSLLSPVFPVTRVWGQASANTLFQDNGSFGSAAGQLSFMRLTGGAAVIGNNTRSMVGNILGTTTRLDRDWSIAFDIMVNAALGDSNNNRLYLSIGETATNTIELASRGVGLTFTSPSSFFLKIHDGTTLHTSSGITLAGTRKLMVLSWTSVTNTLSVLGAGAEWTGVMPTPISLGSLSVSPAGAGAGSLYILFTLNATGSVTTNTDVSLNQMRILRNW